MTTRTKAFELIPDVARLVTPEFLAGAPLASTDAFRVPSETISVDLEGLRRLEEEVLSRFAAREQEMDVWLAPRLHSLLRLTRRQARNQGFWRWMSLEVLPRYVRHRWAAKNGVTKSLRFLGGSLFHRRNGVSRLWWGAEAMRNGSSYAEVEVMFRDSAVEQYVLDLRFGHLRPSALGFARVATGRGGVRKLSFEETRELSKRANLALSATALESLAPPGQDEVGEADAAWLAGEPNVEVLIKQKTEDLHGPADGVAGEDEIRSYEQWYADLALEIVAAAKVAA